MNNKLSGVYFEVNSHLTLNRFFLRVFYVISIVLDAGVVVINKQGISSLCGVYTSVVKTDLDLYLKKPQTAERG